MIWGLFYWWKHEWITSCFGNYQENFEHSMRLFNGRYAWWLFSWFEISKFFFSIANIAKEVADKIFCEATIGSRDKNHSAIVRQLFDRSHFRLRFYPDVEIIEILGAVKNVIAMLAGFADGLKAGFNTRAAVCWLKRTILLSSFWFFFVSRFFD